MKRDMDLCRALLMVAEDRDGTRLAEYSAEDCAGHFLILRDAGLVLGAISGDDRNPGRFVIHRLTWAGHEFLDSLKDDTVWKKAKQYVLKPGASWTFEILKEWLKLEVAKRVGVPPP